MSDVAKASESSSSRFLSIATPTRSPARLRATRFPSAAAFLSPRGPRDDDRSSTPTPTRRWPFPLPRRRKVSFVPYAETRRRASPGGPARASRRGSDGEQSGRDVLRSFPRTPVRVSARSPPLPCHRSRALPVVPRVPSNAGGARWGGRPFPRRRRSVAVVPTVSFGGAPRVFPTCPAGGIVGPYGRPGPPSSAQPHRHRRRGPRGGVNRPRGRGLLRTSTIV